MSIVCKPLRRLLFAFTIATLGCHAQAPEKPIALTPDLARRVEVLIRSRSNLPAQYELRIGTPGKSELPGFNSITVDFIPPGKPARPVAFLISNDGKTLAQLTKFDLSKDPKEAVSAAGKPARGGPVSAPVLIVGFDDLECPFCSKMNAQLFPALLDRYKDQVRIVYRDFPIDQHPWAMRAAVDTNCVGAQSGTGYWNLVDYIHAHASEIGGSEKTISKANEMLDSLTGQEGKRQNVDESKLAACIAGQDDTSIKQSMKEAEALGVDSTPVLFINGEKLEGAQPMEYVYRMIDGALVAAGQTPPAPASGLASAKSGN